MWGDEDCSLSHTKGSDSLDLGRHTKMFRPSCRSSSPFSLTDLDMWDTKSHFTATVRPRHALFVEEQVNQVAAVLKCAFFFLRPQHGMVWKLSLGQGFWPKSAQGEGKILKKQRHSKIHFKVRAADVLYVFQYIRQHQWLQTE